ncbi:MAG TPA: T9SS type A sorting domain-containing protein [Saprospiraceae bacterium]|nr:T9SS type A sorting domain-containing protein [Saprospiraceae bacterium]HNT21373.1 T9SS type A sorting domain-containing protein [Saprospiraceae bacterium]
MKYLCTVALWGISFIAGYSQCKQIFYSAVSLDLISSSGGNNTYTITATFTLNNGNASVKPYYTPGGGAEVALADCWNFPTPSTQTYTSSQFTVPSNATVSLRFIAHANPNCGGTTCEILPAGSQLALDLTQFKISDVVRERACFNWHVELQEPNTLFHLERSMDGKHFSTFATLTFNEISLQGSEASYCANHLGVENYYRLKAVSNEGLTLFSPIRYLNIQTSRVDIQFSPLSRQIRLSGGVDEVFSKPLSVINAYGQVVFQEYIKSDRTGLPELPKGIYFVRIEKEGESILKKIAL